MAHTMLENPLNKLVLLDRFESRDAAHSPLAWDLDTWIGRDLTKLWIRSSGECRDGDNAHAEGLSAGRVDHHAGLYGSLVGVFRDQLHVHER